jgi:hypothetical protein
VISTIALIPANCGCGAELSRLAEQAVSAHVNVYFAGGGQVIPQLPALVARYGAGAAAAVADQDGVLNAYHPAALTVLLAFKDATVEVLRGLPADFQLLPTLRQLKLAGASLSPAQPSAS